jgi:signal transduction histidine kinase
VNDILTTGETPDSQKSNGGIGAEMIRDIRGAIQTIQKRSQGLLHFVDAYRNLTHLPKPSFQIVPVAELFSRVQQLMRPQMKGKAINFRTSVEPESLEVTADPELIEQVLINLLLNAIQSVENQSDARITVTAYLDERGRVIIRTTDNGPGIIEEALEKVFIPFFTTKPDGSGIGLSLSRQIMRLHRGTISVRSTPNIETTFTLRF